MMKIYYFDSSALVKRYHSEKGTETVDKIIEELEKGDESVISYFTILEIVSALRRKLKSKEITKKIFDMAIATFLSEVTEYFSVRPIDEHKSPFFYSHYYPRWSLFCLAKPLKTHPIS
jgi:predicted nucleic acid-binding protein